MISFESDDLKRYEIKSPDYDYIDRRVHIECKAGRFQKDESGLWRNKNAKKGSKALLMFTGDLLCQEKQILAATSHTAVDFRYEFDYVKGIFEQADLVVGNLETPIFPSAPYRSEKYVAEEKFYNNAPVSFLDALSYAGFDVLTTANNHDLDTGVVGLGETIRNVEKYGFIQTGTFYEKKKKYELIDVNGFKIAIVAFTDSHNGLLQNLTKEGAECLLNQYSYDAAQALYSEAKEDGAELVFVMMHWGQEYKHVPSRKQEQYAYELAQIGYDYIVGSHPHVLQPFDKILVGNKSVPVMYSMGNFVSHQVGDRTRNGAILCVTLIRKNNEIHVLNSYIPCMNSSAIGCKKYVTVPTQLSKLPKLQKDKMAIAERKIQKDIGKKLPINKKIERKEVDYEKLKWTPCDVDEIHDKGNGLVSITNPKPIWKYQKLLNVSVGTSDYEPSTHISKLKDIVAGNSEHMKKIAFQHNARVNKLLTKDDPKLTQKQIDEIYAYWDKITNGLFRPDVSWYRLFYSKTNIESPKFIDPSFFYYLLVDQLNDGDYSILRHKCYLTKMFPDWQMKAVAMKVRNIYYDASYNVIDEEKFLDIISSYDKHMIVRPALGNVGEKSTKKLTPFMSKEQICKVLNGLNSDYIVQERIKQHDGLATLSKSGSISYVQILTILDGKTVRPMAAVLKNGESDEIISGIDENGNCEVALLRTVPGYENILSQIEDMHRKLPMFYVIRWNMAVDSKCRPVLLDFSTGYTEIVSLQLANGPLFGDNIDCVLDAVMDKYHVTSYETNFVYDIYRDYCTVQGLNGNSKVFDIPNNYLGRPVNGLRPGLFEGNTYIKKLVFGSNLNKISHKVCKNCTSLEGVRIGGTMTTLIESEAFMGCSKMTNCFISTTIERIESKAFAGCVMLRSVKVPCNVKYIASDAFEGCDKLTLYGEDKSYVQKYAKEHSIPFVKFDQFDIDI